MKQISPLHTALFGALLLAAPIASAFSAPAPSSYSSAAAQDGKAEKDKKAEEENDDDKKAEAEDKKLTLERLFDEKKRWFGSTPRSAEISPDGKHAAYLWRPYEERRHGSDLYLMDLESGESRRITSVSVMAEFQASTKEVAEDRLKKNKKDGKKGEGEGADKEDKSWSTLKDKVKGAPEGDEKSKDDETKDERDLRDVVTEKDADDEKAPRYSGVRGFAWSPTAPELLFTSGGDIYRYQIEGDEGDRDGDDIERMTKTREVEREVQYLPDGSGYTTLLGDALVRVEFGDHFVDQLDPKLPDGMSMVGYELSPDGQKVAFVASAGDRSPGKRTVDIATYRDRFMKVRTVPRTVSDDPISNTKTGVFVYELPSRESEDGELSKIFEQKATGPRDILRVPDWAPDSSRVTFAVFDQETSQIRVLEAVLPDRSAKDEEASKEKAEDGEKAEGETKTPDDDEDAAPDKDEKKTKEKPIEARIVHRFLHTGGPNTPGMIQPRYLADSRRMVMVTEQTGFRQLHVLDPVYESLMPLTQGHFEVYPIGMPKDRSCIFVEATKEDPACQDLYCVNFESGEMKRMSPERGQYSGATFSADGKHVLASFTNFGTSSDLVHIDTTTSEQTRITESHPERSKEILELNPEFFTYDNREGQKIHGFLFEPEEKTEEKRPLLIYVYGGPLGVRKQVTEGNYSTSNLFARYMTDEHGYVTATIDPRGMSGYGAVFEKANFEQVGKPQVNDLVDGVRYLIEHHNVDPERVAIHGWSFGGFQTQMCLYTEPDVFKCGIAGAGPTEWENYNSWYSTGTIGESRAGKTDLAKYSLLPLAKGLKGKLLLVHGMEDPNVLYQDTVRVYAELLDAGKETLVELFLDPTGDHGLGGQVKTLNRFRKYEEFLLRCL
ncbi:Prolyl tripeptidyl peptidase precursor [Planctomycetes bacterium Poly30]|uniref:Prolyl tripeptidyl peptidase n=1 Tax=Saltatorellus ferox TaxID=2528018 RepID=A0A518EN64_9BACT|nr:Prolyl tripeptidyl peptidase precursor [Planctomycetes bacterium Poly30]